MKKRKIILASKSPRRKYLLEQGGFQVEVMSFDVEEVYPEDLELKLVPEYLAKLKTEPAMATLHPNDILLAADTIVVFKNQILGKPNDKDQAFEYIRLMSGGAHVVVTGVCIRTLSSEQTFSVASKVTFASFTDEEINYYVDNYKPYDKAGAYGIQDWIGWTKVKSIEGSYSNIMGLPMHEVYGAINCIC